MKNLKFIFILTLFLIINITFTFSEVQPHEIGFKSLEEKVDYFRNRYKVNCLNEKITDNFGNGFDSLYGTRNMRTILYGIAYRGGANNFYNKFEKRENHNPLPEDGLIHLSQEGFSNVYYLYATNYKDSKKSIINLENQDTLHYLQNSGNSRKDMKKILLDVLRTIQEPGKGPLYLHCWNGWHQSGFVSAAILMQFCKFTNEQAFDYWIQNTDGVNKGYEGVKGQVREFVPFEDISIPDSTRKLICPCMKNK